MSPRPADPDTIVARATPAGRGGIAILRVSGAAVPDIARALLGTLPPPRHARYGAFLDERGEAIDSGIALYFPAPDSYTGEHVLEVQGHGGQVVAELLLERLLALGARLAHAGEFSRRAFENDKLDLTQAEAIADLIDAGTRAAARAAQRTFRGDFARAVLALNEAVTELRMHVEAAIDFPEEEIDFLGDAELAARLRSVQAEFDELNTGVRQGCLLRDGAVVVLAGAPNAGKSSLLNALSGYEAAIVTEVPGTTRDVVREQLDLDGLAVTLTDTAGLRESADRVEQEGMRRARGQLAHADLALLIVDASDPTAGAPALPGELPRLVLRNKIDLTGEPAGPAGADTLNVSARTGEGLDALRAALKHRLGYAPEESGYIARRRHLDALGAARRHFELARGQLDAGAGELMAEELLQVQNHLAEITGDFSSDDLLGRIFAGFCIGK